MAYTTSDLLSGVKRRAQLPDANGALSDADLLALGDIALRTVLVPHLRSVREDYGVTYADQTITASQSDYPIPWRAESAGGLRDVRYVVSTGEELSLPFISLADADLFVRGRNPWWGTPFAFTIQDTTIRLLPQPTQTSGTLRVYYYLRHGALVSTDRATTVSALPGSDVATLTAAVSAFSGETLFDVVDPKPHFDGVLSQTGTYSTGPDQIDFSASGIDSGISVGDYVTLEDEAVVIRLPLELRPVLETATLMHVLEALGDMQAMGATQQILMAQLTSTRTLLEPRIDGEPKIIVNQYGPLRKARRGWRF